MTKSRAESNRLAKLRQRAEARLEREAPDVPDMPPEEARKLVHELQTHQIELEMQNEELRRAQEELVESRDQYSDLYDFAPVGYLTVSEKGILLRANLTVAEMLGVERADLIRSPLSAFVSDDDQDIYYLHRRQLLETRGRQTCELRMRRAGGDPFWAEMESTVTADPDASDRQIRSAIIDISQRKHTQEELVRAKAAAEAANQAKSAFLGNVSHEVRTPLTVIMSLVDVLMSHETPPDQWQEHLQTIHRSAELLLTIINDILDLSKIEAQEIELKRADWSLREIVEQVRALMQVRAAEKKLAFGVDYELPLPDTIRSDRTRLKQILINLVGNAIKFTETGGVKVTVRRVDADGGTPRLQFEVADNGIGMTRQELEEVFEPFAQADTSDTRPFSGTGLGLSISQKLAKLLSGQIEVESQPGKGSTFTLTIDPGPLQQTSATQTTATSSPQEPKPFSPSPPKKFRGRVLLADDVPEIQTSLRLLFGTLDLQLDIAEDGRLAQQKAMASQEEGRPYDLILMDIQMPAIDGYEATRCLRREGWQGPIVALTAHAMAGDGVKCLAAGCNDYLPKPFSRDELLTILAKHLDQATPPSTT